MLGGTGKTGRRVAAQLLARDLPVRVASRASAARFDWYDDTTWAPVLQGAGRVYLVPPLDPGAAPQVAAVAELAAAEGASRLVLLSGRGVGSPGREATTYQASLSIERAVRESGVAWTILRPSWFAQNFSEDFLLGGVLTGEVRLPTGAGAEPFIDVDDVAAVAVAALAGDGHDGQVHEMSGPRTLTFEEATAQVAQACGREIRYVSVPAEEYAAELAGHGVPAAVGEALGDLFTVIRRGLSDHLSDGVQRVLGRAPRDFADYAATAASTGVWNQVSAA